MDRNLQRGLAPSFAGAWRPSASRQPHQTRRACVASRKRNTTAPDCHEIAWRARPRRDRKRKPPRLRSAVPQRVVERAFSPHTPFIGGTEKRGVKSQPRNATIITYHPRWRGTRSQAACLWENSWPTSEHAIQAKFAEFIFLRLSGNSVGRRQRG